ncbi:MAG: class I SAM-dependent methyltransferase [Lachnospiraceae bacterium]|nr:class I SAM-dependent methyltransferase [Lachnospiraceae bacterium]
MDYTLDFYNEHAQSFIENTKAADMHQVQEHFLQLLSEGSSIDNDDNESPEASKPVGDSGQDGASILDFGCGSGRDTRYFLEKGYQVTATDGSSELCRLASEYTGIQVKKMLFQELDDKDCYDGIWACSSILHLPKTELLPVFHKIRVALKTNGILYTSFKYGDFEGERNGRYFTDFTEESLLEILRPISELTMEECWITEDVRPGRGDEKWLNVILRKK